MNTIRIEVIDYHDTRIMLDTEIPICCIPKVSEGIFIWDEDIQDHRVYQVAEINKFFDVDGDLSLEVYVL